MWPMAAAVFLVLAWRCCRGAWVFLAGSGAFDALSFAVLLRHGVIPLAGVASLVAAACGVGLRLQESLPLEPNGEDRGLRRCLAFCLGLGLLGECVFILGLAGGLSRGPLALLAAVFASAGWPAAAAELRRGPKPSAAPSLWKGALAGLLVFVAFNAVILALAPPTEWDVVAYHLVIPKQYLEAGRIGELPWMLHSHWPHLMEALYCLPLAFGSDGAAALIHAAACAAWLCLTFCAARRWLNGSTGWLAVSLLACQPLVLRLAGTAHSDGAVALFHLAACSALWLWKDSAQRRLLALAGVLSGFGACAKLLGAIPLAALTAWIWLRPPARGGKGASRNALMFLLPALAVAAPWLIKTWLGAGDPVWPFLSFLFGARWGGEAIVRAYRASNDMSWALVGLWNPEAPILLILPTALAGGMALIRRERWPRFLVFLAMPAPLYVLLLCRHGQLWRFLWLFWPVAALTVGWWGGRWLGISGASPAPRLRWVAGAAVVIGLAGLGAASPNNELFPVLGLRSARQPEADRRLLYLDRTMPLAPFCRRVNAMLAGRAAKVLLFREIRGYYLDLPYLWGDPVNQGLILYERMPDPAALSARLDELGITHVLVNEELYRGGYYVRAQALMDGVLARRGRRVLREGNLFLYELGPAMGG